MSIEKLLEKPDLTPIALNEILNRVYNTEWIITPIRPLILHIERIFNIKLPQENIDKIGAIKVLLNNDSFWDHWHIFEKVGVAFNDHIVRTDIMQPLQACEAIYTFKTSRYFRKEKFSDEVIVYAYFCCLEDNCILPDLEFIEMVPEKMYAPFSNILNELKKHVKHLQKLADVNKLPEEMRAQAIEYLKVQTYLALKENATKEQINAINT